MYYMIIAALIIILDQFTKYLIQSNMDLLQSIPVWEGIFHLTYIQNFGAAFNILEGRQFLLIAVTMILNAAILIFIYIKRNSSHWSLLLGLSFIAGGGIGNLINRITKGYVVDFFDFHIWPVFNISDIFVCIGCGLLFIYIFFFDSKNLKKDTIN